MSNYKIVIIHDDLPDNDPLIAELEIKYGQGSVKLIKKSQEGLDYVLDNLNQKIIVILDLNFKTGEPSGVQVFEDIRQKTSLVYVLIWTSSDIADINKDDLKSMINNDALGLLSSTDDVDKILSMVDLAAHRLDTRVSSALEDWINSQPELDRTKPYITSKEGKTYNLDQILEEVRLQTPFGMQTEKNILLLAIDMLVENEESKNGEV